MSRSAPALSETLARLHAISPGRQFSFHVYLDVPAERSVIARRLEFLPITAHERIAMTGHLARIAEAVEGLAICKGPIHTLRASYRGGSLRSVAHCRNGTAFVLWDDPKDFRQADHRLADWRKIIAQTRLPLQHPGV